MGAVVQDAERILGSWTGEPLSGSVASTLGNCQLLPWAGETGEAFLSPGGRSAPLLPFAGPSPATPAFPAVCPPAVLELDFPACQKQQGGWLGYGGILGNVVLAHLKGSRL